MTLREEIQQATNRIDRQSITHAVAAAKRGDPSGRLQLTGVMAWVAYACPDATNAVYDNIASAWLGCGPTPEIPVSFAQRGRSKSEHRDLPACFSQNAILHVMSCRTR